MVGRGGDEPETDNTMSTAEQKLEAAKVILSDVAEYLEDRSGEVAAELRDKIDQFLEASE